jgi:TPP-dependent pyruvate/acetoin dehydrogenase alpha subunit
LLEAVIDRWEAHAVGIKELRTEVQITEARTRDGVKVLRQNLMAAGVLTEADAAAIDCECSKEISSAIEEFTRESHQPAEAAPISESDALTLALAT